MSMAIPYPTWLRMNPQNGGIEPTALSRHFLCPLRQILLCPHCIYWMCPRSICWVCPRSRDTSACARIGQLLHPILSIHSIRTCGSGVHSGDAVSGKISSRRFCTSTQLTKWDPKAAQLVRLSAKASPSRSTVACKDASHRLFPRKR